MLYGILDSRLDISPKGLYAVSDDPVSFWAQGGISRTANIGLGWDQAANGNLGELAQTLVGI
jgi:hypothetical protein